MTNRNKGGIVGGVDWHCTECLSAEIHRIPVQITCGYLSMREGRFEISQHPSMATRKVQDAPDLSGRLCNCLQARGNTLQSGSADGEVSTLPILNGQHFVV